MAWQRATVTHSSKAASKQQHARDKPRPRPKRNRRADVSPTHLTNNKCAQHSYMFHSMHVRTPARPGIAPPSTPSEKTESAAEQEGGGADPNRPPDRALPITRKKRRRGGSLGIQI